MKIYTKTGDLGITSLIGGKRVSKSSIRIESYGNVDELNSFLGLLKDQLDNPYKKNIEDIQSNLFVIGAQLANEDINSYKIPSISESDILKLEREIDIMNENLPPLRSFTLPGGNIIVSNCQISRAVCRRAERAIQRLSEQEVINMLIIKYLNRLSDYLFVFGRLLIKEFKIIEIKWQPKLKK